MKVYENATQFQTQLGLEAKDSTYIEHALVHQSYVQKKVSIDKTIKEKLHMLGDKLYRLLIADLIFQNVTTDTGAFNFFVQELDQRDFVLKLADTLSLSSFILAGKGFNWDEVKKEPFLYNVLAALYIEHGYNTVTAIVNPVFFQMLDDIKEKPRFDYYSALEEWAKMNSHSIKTKDHGTEIREQDGQLLVKKELQVADKRIKGKGPTEEVAIKRIARQYSKRFISKEDWSYPLNTFTPVTYRRPRVMLAEDRLERLKKIPFFNSSRVVLLHQSLVHKSYLNDDKTHGEIDATGLSTLGSYVQSFIFANHLFFNDENLDIHEMQKLKQIHTYLIGYKTNTVLFDKLELGRLLWKGRTVKSPSNKMKTDTVKALFGALYLSKRDFNIEPKSMMKTFLWQYIPDIADQYERESLDPKSMLQELTRMIGPSWGCKFRHQVVTDDQRVVNRVESIVEITNANKVMFRKKAKGPSSKEAFSIVTKRMLQEMNSAFNLKETPETRAPYSLLFRELINQLLYTPKLKEKKAREITGVLGGLGLQSLELNLYRQAFTEIESTVHALESAEMYHIDQVFYKAYHSTGFMRDFKYNILDINPYLDELSHWLNLLSYNSPIEQLEPFIKNIADVLQVFRFIDEGSFRMMDLLSVFNGIKSLNHLRVDLDINFESENLKCFGQPDFIFWFFNSIISNLENYLVESTCLPVNVQVKRNQTGDAQVEILFDPNKVENKFYEDLYIVTQFATFSFMEFEVEQGYLKFNCFDFGSKNENELPAKILQWVHDTQVKSVMELSPLGGLMHDLKNKLITIKRKILMYQRRGKGSEAELAKLGEASIELTDQLLSFFKYTKVRKHKFNLADLISQVNEEMKLLENIENTVVLNTEVPLETMVRSDRKMIYSVISNLAKNGLESLENGTGKLRMSYQLDDSVLGITISDDGCGIPIEKQKTLFTSFYTTKTSKNGSGVGLPTVKRILDLLNGDISFESRQNEGTTFYIKIPVKYIETR